MLPILVRKSGGAIVNISSITSILIAVYSAVLGLFVRSAGSKWLIEAPYLLQAATQLHVNLGWVVQIYNTAEALPNLINPSGCCYYWAS